MPLCALICAPSGFGTKPKCKVLDELNADKLNACELHLSAGWLPISCLGNLSTLVAADSQLPLSVDCIIVSFLAPAVSLYRTL